MIRDRLIKAMKDMNELEDYIEKTEDIQLGMMVEIVKEYDNKIPGIINIIKEKHLKNDEKIKAEVIFSTVHRCKGMEYDSVQLVNDFMTEVKLENLTKGKKAEEINSTKLNEEINLLYVAVTRTKNSIHIPEALMPKEFPRSPQIHVLRIPAESGKYKIRSKGTWQENYTAGTVKEKTYMIDEIRSKHKDA